MSRERRETVPPISSTKKKKRSSKGGKEAWICCRAGGGNWFDCRDRSPLQKKKEGKARILNAADKKKERERKKNPSRPPRKKKAINTSALFSPDIGEGGGGAIAIKREEKKEVVDSIEELWRRKTVRSRYDQERGGKKEEEAAPSIRAAEKRVSYCRTAAGGKLWIRIRPERGEENDTHVIISIFWGGGKKKRSRDQTLLITQGRGTARSPSNVKRKKRGGDKTLLIENGLYSPEKRGKEGRSCFLSISSERKEKGGAHLFHYHQKKRSDQRRLTRSHERESCPCLLFREKRRRHQKDKHRGRDRVQGEKKEKGKETTMSAAWWNGPAAVHRPKKKGESGPQTG